MKHIIKTLELAEELLGGSAKREISEIERDIILDKLRKLYSAVLALEENTIAVEEVVVPVVPVASIAEEVAPEEESAVEEIEEEESPVAEIQPEPEVEESIAEPATEVEENVVEESIAEPAPEVEENVVEESIAEPAPEVKNEEAVQEVVVIEEPVTAAEEAMLSLYDDDDDDDDDVVVEEQPTEESVVEPAPEVEVEVAEEPTEEVVYEENVVEEQPAEEEKEPAAPAILGEVLVEEQTRLGDTFADRVADADVASAAAAVSSLRQSITLNDKYILMRDLFAGDNEYYNSVISELDSFESLEDAMLYIYDNHHWNPNSEGVLLLMDLLSRKLF